MRKTYPIDELRTMINDYILNTPDDFVGERRGMMTVLESALHATGNYKGFGYLNKRDMLKSHRGTSVGVNTDPEGSVAGDYTYRFKDTDKTRVCYFK